MHRSDWKSVLDAVGTAALEHLRSLPDRRVYPQGEYADMRAALTTHPPKQASTRRKSSTSSPATSGRISRRTPAVGSSAS